MTFAGGWLSNVGHTALPRVMLVGGGYWDELLAAARSAGLALLLAVALTIALYAYRSRKLTRELGVDERAPESENSAEKGR